VCRFIQYTLASADAAGVGFLDGETGKLALDEWLWMT
jgi:hypothetical protein